MNDPQNLGLGELGQRVQAMGDPLADSRLRPYQGTPQPIVPASNGRPIPPYEPLEDLRSAPPIPPVSVPPVLASYSNSQFPSAGPFSGPAASPAASPVYPWETMAPSGRGPEYTQPSPSQPAPLPATASANHFGDPSNPNAPKTGLQRAINAVRSTLPLVQKLLPLLDGNFVTAISGLVVPQPVHHPPPAPVRVDLEPVERGLAEVRTSHRELRTQVQEQVTSLKRVEDQLERVREATDRNTLEQQELVEDLRSVGSRVSTFAIIGLTLLAVSLGLNVYFLIQLQHILR
jgi:hypothetical protein